MFQEKDKRASLSFNSSYIYIYSSQYMVVIDLYFLGFDNAGMVNSTVSFQKYHKLKFC